MTQLTQGTEVGSVGVLFGTDGVREIANGVLTPELAFRLGRAGAAMAAASTGSGGRDGGRGPA